MSAFKSLTLKQFIKSTGDARIIAAVVQRKGTFFYDKKKVFKKESYKHNSLTLHILSNKKKKYQLSTFYKKNFL